MIDHNHFSYSFSLFRTLVIFNICVGIDMFVSDHDVKALIDNFPIAFAIDHISYLISFERMLVPPLDNSGLFLFHDVFFDILESLGHKNKHYT